MYTSAEIFLSVGNDSILTDPYIGKKLNYLNNMNVILKRPKAIVVSLCDCSQKMDVEKKG